MKVKSGSEVAQSCLTLSDPMDCSPPGSSIHGIFQARVLEWGAIAQDASFWVPQNSVKNEMESHSVTPWDGYPDKLTLRWRCFCRLFLEGNLSRNSTSEKVQVAALGIGESWTRTQ